MIQSTISEPVIDHEARRKRLGASEVAAVLGMSPYTTAWEVWANKVGMLQPWKGNAATKAGNRLEHVILDYAEEELGPLERQKLIQADGTPIASTLDGLTTDGIVVEAKTAGILGPLPDGWGDTELEEVPEYYFVQVQTQLFCSGADIAYLYAMLGGQGIKAYPIRRSADIPRMVDFLCKWWDRHVIGGDEPERTVPVPLELLKRRKRIPNKEIQLTDDLLSLIEERQLVNDAMKDLKTRKESIDRQLIESLDDAECGVLSGCEITYFETHRKGYTVDPTTYRTLRVKKAK